jgi:hypothetical protein
MSRTFTLALLCLLLTAVVIIPERQSVAQVRLAATEVLGKDILPPGGDSELKYPSIDGFQNAVHLAANPGEKASYWSKADNSSSWPSRTVLGEAPEQPDYASADVAVGHDGSIYYVWVHRGAKRIYMRRTTPGAGFGGRITVARADDFAIFPRVGVSASGQIFVIWNAADRMRYVISNDGGANWSGKRTFGPSKNVTGLPAIVTDPNGTVMEAHYAEGNIYANIWNGSTFVTETVADNDEFFSDPTAAVTPDGQMYVAWRSFHSVWYAERQPDGSWPLSRLATAGDADIFGRVSISSDSGGNLYVFWLSNRTGRLKVYTAFKPVGQNWEGPTTVDVEGGFIANVEGAATLGVGSSYGHAVYESFEGGDVTLRYALVATEAVGGPPEGSIRINNDEPATNSSSVQVQVEVTNGQADQYKLSNDGSIFSEYAAIPEGGIASWELESGSGKACVNRTVHGHVRAAERPDLESAMMSDAILFDPGVDATVTIRNPYYTGNPVVFSDTPALQDDGVAGPSNGDPRYTRIRGYFMEVRGLAGECSGLTQLSVDNQTITISDNYYSTIRALPAFDAPATNSTSITVRDAVGHEEPYQATIYYDDVSPAVTSGALQIVDLSGTPVTTSDTILVTLSFESLTVTDNLYGQNGENKPFWGVWVANSRSDIDPQSSTELNALNWSPVEVQNVTGAGTGSYSFTVSWSLLSGLAASQWSGGDYFVYARILDGAGNWSDTTLKYTIALSDNYQMIELGLPFIAR